MLALRVLCRRRRPNQSRHRPGGPRHRSRPGLGNSLTRLGENSPNCAVLVTSSSHDGQLILRAMRAGAKEFLTQPVADRGPAGRPGTHQRTPQRPRREPAPRQPGRGRGRLAGRRGQHQPGREPGLRAGPEPKNSVTLVDLDLCLGDADIFLDAIPDYTLVDVAQNVTRLDFSLLKRSLTKHSSGVYLLPRPVQLEDCALITPDDLRRVIGLLEGHLHAPRARSEQGLQPAWTCVALEMANHILLVTQLDLPCLRNVVRLMMSFNEMEGIAEKVKIVVNRAGLDNGHISVKKAEETIGKEIFWQLPNEYRTMIEARNNGVPLIEQSPKAAITQSIMALAAALFNEGKEETEDAAEAKKPARKGLFGFLGGKKLSGLSRFVIVLQPHFLLIAPPPDGATICRES